MRIGLVLGGGGLTGGAFHAGVLGALADAGWDARTADVLLGTSAGAITATSLAAGMPPADMVRRHLGEPLSPAATAMLARVSPGARGFAASDQPVRAPASPALLGALLRNPRQAHPGKLAAAALPVGRVPTDAIAGGMDQLCQGKWPSDRLRITALRLRDGATVVFGRPGVSRPTVGSAVAASCAIPGYFAPVTIGGERYVDGGTTSACNAEAVLPEDLDAVIISAPMAIHSGARLALDTPWRRALRRQVDSEISKLRGVGTQVFLFAPTADVAAVMGANPMAAGREPAVARAAYRAAAERLNADPRLRDL
jgi:NTE family protein